MASPNPNSPDLKQTIFIAMVLVMILLFALVVSLVAKNHEITTKYNDLVVEARSCIKYASPPLASSDMTSTPKVTLVDENEKEDNDAGNFSDV